MFNNLSLSTDRVTEYCFLFTVIRVQFYSVGVSQILYKCIELPLQLSFLDLHTCIYCSKYLTS